MRIAGARFLGIGRVAPDPSWRMKAHCHAFHELILVVRGRMRVTARDGTEECAAGDAVLYPAGLVHAESADADDPVETLFVSFLCPGLRREALVRVFDDRGRMLQMARWLHEDRLATGPNAQRKREILVSAMLAEFAQDPRGESPQIVTRTRRYVYEHVGERLTLSDLAAASGLSKYHFLRRFKRAAGRTPMQEVRAIRIGYARELLQSTSLPLKEVAPAAGLGSEFSLSRLFRRELGMSPGKFRRFPGRRTGV